MGLSIYNRYAAGAIVILIMIILYFYYTSGKEAVTPTPRKTKKAKKKKTKKSKKEKLSEPDNSDDDDDEDKAAELFNLVHDNIVNGMTNQQFEQAVDGLVDPFVYLELKQLYLDESEKNKDPSKTITVEHYRKVLEKAQA